MDIVTKEATATVEPVESDNPNGEFDVILSTDDLDRDGERLYADEWKTPLPTRINFDSDHGMSVEKTVGSGKPFINDAGQLQVRGVFASTPHAQAVRTLVNEGHITSTSVAFQQSKTKKDAKPERELLNGSFVSVPANPEAVILASKAKTSGSPAGESPTDTPPAESDQNVPSHDSLVQAIHDATVHLGADCLPDADDGETDGANKSLLAAILKADPDKLQAVLDQFKGTSDDKNTSPAELNPADYVAISRNGLATGLKTSDSQEVVGSLQESPDTEPAAAVTEKSLTAEAADLSADDVALRSRAFLITKSVEAHLDDT